MAPAFRQTAGGTQTSGSKPSQAGSLNFQRTDGLLWQCDAVRFLLKLVIPLAVLLVLAIGLLPPVFDRGTLDTDAVNAAKAGAAALSVSGPAAAEAAVRGSIAGDTGVTLVSVQINPSGQTQTVQVTLSRTVHTFMDGIPGLKGWFHMTSTQDSSLGV